MAVFWRNTRSAWGVIARSIHWLLAVLILLQFGLGKFAEGMAASPSKIDAFVWHKSIGVTILLLVVLRLAWRLTDPPPPPPATIPPRETKLAAAGHFLLYVLMFAVPISGWLSSDASRIPFKAYFAVPMPDLVEANRSLQETVATVHEAFTTALLVLVLIHVAAALRHHFGLRNDVLRRMLLGRTKETG